MKQRILIVDDDNDILELLRYNLEQEGYEVRTLANSLRTVSAAKTFLPDLIILDIMMPNLNGVEVCKALRKSIFKSTYIFFLTARSEDYYQKAVFETGGDDYIHKVSGIKALTKKIGLVLKDHLTIRKGVSRIALGDLLLNRQDSSVTIQNAGKERRVVHLAKVEFELLFLLAQNMERSITAEHVVQCLWGSQTFMGEKTIDIYIQNVHSKLGCNLIHRFGDSICCVIPDVIN
jgi:two-component system, OmpR family, alkaline phosphatase synthesis response regulator PhoP